MNEEINFYLGILKQRVETSTINHNWIGPIYGDLLNGNTKNISLVG
jgi:hypothetical protein